ncbi:hypothetical protein Emed_006537 [Eimeria media]
MAQEKEMSYVLTPDHSGQLSNGAMMLPPQTSLNIQADEAPPPLSTLRQVSLCVAVGIFLCSACGIVLGSLFSLLTVSSFCCQVTLAVAALGLAALEAPRQINVSLLEEVGADDPRLHIRRATSLLERGVVACLVGVFGVWHFWVNVMSGLLCFLLTLVGLFEVSVHFIGGGEAEAIRILRRGSAFAHGAMANKSAWASFSPNLPWAPGIITQKEESIHSLAAGGLLQQQQQQLLLLPHLPEAAAETASAPIRYPDSPSDFQQQQQQQQQLQQQQSLQQQQLLMPNSRPLERLQQLASAAAALAAAARPLSCSKASAAAKQLLLRGEGVPHTGGLAGIVRSHPPKAATCRSKAAAATAAAAAAAGDAATAAGPCRIMTACVFAAVCCWLLGAAGSYNLEIDS